MAILIPDGTGAMIVPEDIRVQGSDGIWESVPSVMVQASDGIWEQVWPERLYLYNRGEVSDLTGGFTKYTNIGSDYYNQDTFSYVYAANKIVFTNTASNQGVIALGANNKIDITNYKKLVANGYLVNSTYAYDPSFGIAKSMGSSWSSAGENYYKNGIHVFGNISSASGLFCFNLDLSGLSGEFYVFIRGVEICKIEWYDIYLEI